MSPTSRLAGDFSASDSRLTGDQKVSYQPAGRRPRLRIIIGNIRKQYYRLMKWLTQCRVRIIKLPA